MEFGKAFLYQFDDREWLKKLGIGNFLRNRFCFTFIHFIIAKCCITGLGYYS